MATVTTTHVRFSAIISAPYASIEVPCSVMDQSVWSMPGNAATVWHARFTRAHPHINQICTRFATTGTNSTNRRALRRGCVQDSIAWASTQSVKTVATDRLNWPLYQSHIAVVRYHTPLF